MVGIKKIIYKIGIFIPFFAILLMSHNTYAVNLQTSSFDLYYRVNNNSSYGWRNNITYGSNSPTVIDAGGGITRYQFNTPSVQAGGNYATIHFETNIVASPYSLVNNFNPWVNLPQQNILTCSASGIAVVSKNLSFATTYWVDQNNESNNTLTYYGDVVLSGFNPGSSYSLVCSIGSSSYSFIDYNGVAVWFEQNPMSIVWSNDESLALMQTQIEQQNTIINQNETIINNQTQNTQDIIDNQTQNTQDIIDNQTQNTQDIIDNQTQNTQDIIRFNQNCHDSKNLFDGVVKSGEFSNSGNINANSNRIYSVNYIKVEPNTQYVANNQINRVCFYDADKTFLNRSSSFNFYTFTTPANTYFVRFDVSTSTDISSFQLEKGSTASAYEPYGEICKNINEEYYDEQRQADENISNQSSSDIEGAENQVTTNLIGVLSGFISAFSNINATNCNITLDFPNYAGGSRTVNICSGKEKAPRIVEIGSSLLLIGVFVPLAYILIKMIYNEIRSWTNG